MNRDLNAVSIFAAVVESGGFSKAAKRLGLTNSVISHHVSKLEERLGVTLLYRSTRRVSLSEQGKEFYDQVSEPLVMIENALHGLAVTKTRPHGVLHISLPAFMPEPKIEQLLWEFSAQYKDVVLELSYSDNRQDLIGEGFDMAFRIGALESSGMRARKLADIPLIFVASPHSFEIENILSPKDIQDLPFIVIQQMPTTQKLVKDELVEVVNVGSGRVKVDNIYAAKDAAVFGRGVAILPWGICEREISSNKLVQIMPDWKLKEVPLFAVWHNVARTNSLTKIMLDFLVQD